MQAVFTPQWYIIYYKCPMCDAEWEDEWDCAVDAECPECDHRHINPEHYEEYTP